VNDQHVTRSLADEGAADRPADEVRCQVCMPADDDDVGTDGCCCRKYLRRWIAGSTDEVGGDLPAREKTFGFEQPMILRDSLSLAHCLESRADRLRPDDVDDTHSPAGAD